MTSIVEHIGINQGLAEVEPLSPCCGDKLYRDTFLKSGIERRRCRKCRKAYRMFDGKTLLKGEKSPIESPAVKRCITVLQETEKPLSMSEVAELAHVSRNSFKGYIRKQLTAPVKRIYIAEWRDYRYGSTPAFLAGNKKDAPMPSRYVPGAQRSKSWREKTGYNEMRKAERRVRNASQMGALLFLASMQTS